MATSTLVQFPYPGMETHVNAHGTTVLRLHYSADPEKATGEKTFVPEIKRALSPWALKQYQGMTDRSLYLQEYEIDASATMGQLLYHMDKEATLVHSRNLPEDGTDYFAIDPHEVKPFASLWGRVDRWGDLWIFREFWPSRVCFRYIDGVLEGQRGAVPDDDQKHNIRDYVEALWWFESDQNPQNKGRAQEVWRRAIDYAARGMGKGTQDDPEESPNFQQRIETHAAQIRKEKNDKWRLEFEDAKKDLGVGIMEVNAWLKPREVRHPSEDRWIKRSRVLICQDRCPELIYQIENNRNAKLTPLQAEVSDPKLKAIQKRNDLTDDLRYLIMMNPTYREHATVTTDYRPPVEGFTY